MDLFQRTTQQHAPLADRMRPSTLEAFLGQEHLLAPGRLLRRAIEADRLTSSIFFGPPGCGKTTLAAVIAHSTKSNFVKLNAVTSGVKEVREVIEEAEKQLKFYGKATYLLLDECHRWSKAQSDSVLPALESGIIRFIGSTTENPTIAMTPAIVSRCRLFEFFPLNIDHIKTAVLRALEDNRNGLGSYHVQLDDDALTHIANIANGDVRSALNAIELGVLTTAPDNGTIHVTLEVAEESIQKRALYCDDQLLYDMLSAFCKSLRGSDSNAAIAWFARLITGGVDPRILARRIIAHASEDVGMANPNAMLQAVAAAQALEMVGLPEARLSLIQAIIFVCESPKSNAVVGALGSAFGDVQDTINEPVPNHLRDTAYKGSKRLGYGEGYQYAHNYPGHWVEQEYMPPSVRDKIYYYPSDQGHELRIRDLQRARQGFYNGEKKE